VSRVHAKIVKENGANVLIDLESRTGTRVNGAPVQRHALVSGDVIEIASAQLEYRE
jgi:pSer/pThr/pTyr-binding forkhead associated (FHA) protein